MAVTLVCPAIAQVAILQIQFIEGEGAVHAPGSRSARPLTVEVTDETGRPVPGAAVSFHLPDEGPGGAFANGLRTEVAVTDAQGRVSLHGLQVNRMPGRFQIRVVANKEQARAGVVVVAVHRGAEERRGDVRTRRAMAPRVRASADAMDRDRRNRGWGRRGRGRLRGASGRPSPAPAQPARRGGNHRSDALHRRAGQHGGQAMKRLLVWRRC